MCPWAKASGLQGCGVTGPGGDGSFICALQHCQAPAAPHTHTHTRLPCMRRPPRAPQHYVSNEPKNSRHIHIYKYTRPKHTQRHAKMMCVHTLLNFYIADVGARCGRKAKLICKGEFLTRAPLPRKASAARLRWCMQSVCVLWMMSRQPDYFGRVCIVLLAKDTPTSAPQPHLIVSAAARRVECQLDVLSTTDIIIDILLHLALGQQQMLECLTRVC